MVAGLVRRVRNIIGGGDGGTSGLMLWCGRAWDGTVLGKCMGGVRCGAAGGGVSGGEDGCACVWGVWWCELSGR